MEKKSIKELQRARKEDRMKIKGVVKTTKINTKFMRNG